MRPLKAAGRKTAAVLLPLPGMTTEDAGSRTATTRRPARGALPWGRIGTTILKVGATAICLVLVSRQLDAATVRRLLGRLDPAWLLLAIALIAVEVPLVGERWRLIVHSLGNKLYDVPRLDIQAANAFGVFVGQVLPSIAGDGARAIVLRGNGVSLAHAAWSVLLDRAIGVYVLFGIALGVLFLPSGLSALGGYRQPILLTVALVVAGGTFALALAGMIGRRIQAIPRLRFIGTALVETRTALLGRSASGVFGISLAIHGLSILAAFALGRSLGLPLPLTDAAVLMVCMVAVTLLPIFIGGWGVRELAVAALLTSHGASAEEAVVYSVAFGLAVMVATLPGAFFWLFWRIGGAGPSA